MITEQQARRNAKLISTLYIIVATTAREGTAITYTEIERIMAEQQHCSPLELMQACLELHHFCAIIQQAEKG